jgi:hypothetical protein
MVRAIVKIWDVSPPASGSDPQDPTNFSELFLFGIGPDDGTDGQDWFDLEVVTPAWLARQVNKLPGYVFSRGMLVIDHWDPELAVQAMRTLCEQIPDSEWEHVSEYLSRYSWHEFDRYRVRLPQDWRRSPD